MEAGAHVTVVAPEVRQHPPGMLVIGAVAALNDMNAGAPAPELRAPGRA